MIERAELHKTIWRIANDLREAWTGGTSKLRAGLHHRFISEKLTDHMNTSERKGDPLKVERLRRPQPSITRPSDEGKRRAIENMCGKRDSHSSLRPVWERTCAGGR